MWRLNTDRQERLEAKRIEYAKKKIIAAGYEITYEDSRRIEFQYKGKTVKFFPYSGWHSGKTIRDGRGLVELLNQITAK